MKREVRVSNDFGSALTAHFEEQVDGALVERANRNYYLTDGGYDFMKFATESYMWIIEGIYP